MTPDEFRAALKALNIRQKWLATKLGKNPGTVSHWANGKMPVPQYAVYVLELLSVQNDVAQQLNPKGK